MLNPDTGAPHTAHTTNKVPFILTGSGKYKFKEDKPKGTAESKADSKEQKKAEEEEEEEGALCDVAPTILDILVSCFVKQNFGVVLIGSLLIRVCPNRMVSECTTNQYTHY